VSGAASLKHHNEEGCSLCVCSSNYFPEKPLITGIGKMSPKGIQMLRSKYERLRVTKHGDPKGPTWLKSLR
jgi:hypothetical protein